MINSLKYIRAQDENEWNNIRDSARSTEEREQMAEDLLDAYSHAVVTVAEKVGPSVVSIKTTQEVKARTPRGVVPFDMSGGGSGVVITPDGYILTNSHVVNNTKGLEVFLSDRRSFSAQLIGQDADTDLAVIRMPASGLPTAELGDSEKLRSPSS